MPSVFFVRIRNCDFFEQQVSIFFCLRAFVDFFPTFVCWLCLPFSCVFSVCKGKLPLCLTFKYWFCRYVESNFSYEKANMSAWNFIVQ